MRHIFLFMFIVWAIISKAQTIIDGAGNITNYAKYSDSVSIYQSKWKCDTMKANLYTVLAGKSATNHTHAIDSTILQPKYRSDTARANTYTALAGKQPTGNYLTSLVSGTASIGYSTGNGGTVTQATSKSTGVTLNKLAGEITMNGAALAAATIVSFTLTNSTIAATDVIFVQHQATGTFGAYTINARSAAGSAVFSVRNNSAASLSEAIVIRYIVIKSTVN